MCAHAHTLIPQHVCEDREHIMGLGSLLPTVGPRDQIQIFRLGSKRLYPQSQNIY